MIFGLIDPSGVSNVTATSAGLTYKCSTGTTFNITGITGGSSSSGTCASFTGTMLDGSGHTLNYNLSCGAGPYTGLGFGATSAIGIALNGTITPLQFQNAFAAAYTDTVTVTVTN